VLHSGRAREKKERSWKGSGGSHKNEGSRGEAADFLRIIKSSEYSIVKQLSKMPSHISVLSLLLASESHRKALLKVLNEAYVPEDITGPSFENMVTSILVTNQLTFSDDELPPEGRGHTKALYISVKTNDRVVSRVLIDNGSALNVCPLSTLEKLDIDPTRVRVNSMVVRAFDGTRREVLGEIDLPVEIGPQVYDINFQVLRIDSPYNLLLGKTVVTYSRSSTLLPTPKNEAHHRQPIGHHPSRRTHIHLQRQEKFLTLTDVHQKKHHSTVLSLSPSSTEWRPLNQDCPKLGSW
jgi:hypothetical protein